MLQISSINFPLCIIYNLPVVAWCSEGDPGSKRAEGECPSSPSEWYGKEGEDCHKAQATCYIDVIFISNTICFCVFRFAADKRQDCFERDY